LLWTLMFWFTPIVKTLHSMKQPTEGLSSWLRVELHGLFHGHVSTSFSQLLLTLEFTIPQHHLKLLLIKSRHGLNHSLLSCYQNQQTTGRCYVQPCKAVESQAPRCTTHASQLYVNSMKLVSYGQPTGTLAVFPV
jgi:hypothetical protein